MSAQAVRDRSYGAYCPACKSAMVKLISAESLTDGYSGSVLAPFNEFVETHRAHVGFRMEVREGVWEVAPWFAFSCAGNGEPAQ